MTKILNVDALIGEDRVLTLFGVDYAVDQLSVDNFVLTNTDADSLKDEKSLAKQVEATIRMIQRAVPNCPKEVLGRLPLAQLQTVAAFVRGDDPTPETPASAEGDLEGKVADPA